LLKKGLILPNRSTAIFHLIGKHHFVDYGLDVTKFGQQDLYLWPRGEGQQLLSLSDVWDEFSSILFNKGVTRCCMGDMVGDKLTQESPEGVFRHGCTSPDVACCRVMALRKTSCQLPIAEMDRCLSTEFLPLPSPMLCRLLVRYGMQSDLKKEVSNDVGSCRR
jgi:hypothetical protein